MIIAIDHGNYSIKTPLYVFLAGLSEHTVRPLKEWLGERGKG